MFDIFSPMKSPLLCITDTVTFVTLFLSVLGSSSFSSSTNTCRTFCGNLTIDYPFSTRSGCGHPAYRDLLFCINDILMLHVVSGTYRVLNIDYAYSSLTLHDPYMSTCNSITRGKANGFVLETWRSPFLSPSADNIFMLLGCSAQSPLFQGFPTQHLPCRNVSGMSCENFFDCPAWDRSPETNSPNNTAPPECCALSFESIRAINLSRLQCDGYSSAYSLAPLRKTKADEWFYGIRISFSVPANHVFCRACQATGGICGYAADAVGGATGAELCLCGDWNSTSTCDHVSSITAARIKPEITWAAFFTLVLAFMIPR